LEAYTVPRITPFSEAANLAVHALACLANEPARTNVAAGAIAETLGVSETYLSKVLQQLVKAKLVHSSRGPSGGFAIACDPRRLTLLQIVEIVDGELESPGCLLGRPICAGGRCILSGALEDVVQRIRAHLERTRLADFQLDATFVAGPTT
jgi:Rrf2 family protein